MNPDEHRSTPSTAPAADILDALGAGVLGLDAAWRIVFATQPMAEMLGVERGAMTGRDFWRTFPALAGSPHEHVLREVMADGVPRSFRVMQRGAIDGAFHVHAARAPGHALVLEARDVTRVARLERDHDELLESIGESLLVVDAAWRFVYWNAAAERLVGLNRAQLLGARLWDRFPALVGTGVERAFRRTMTERAPQQVRGWSLTAAADASGESFYDARSYPVDGGGVLVLFAEATERVRRERELAERSRENEGLRELARAMAAISDSADLLQTLCDAALEQCGATGAAVAQVTSGEAAFVGGAGFGVPLRGVRFPLAGSLTEEVLRSDTLNLSSYRSQAPHMRSVARVIGSGPIVLTPLRAHGTVLGVLYLWRANGAAEFSERDVARVRVIADHASLALHKARLIEEAQGANEAKNNFLASVSHELRTPITALTGYGELLADGILGEVSKPQQEVIERMRAVTHHLSALIDEILTYTSLEAGREIVRHREVSAADLLDDIVAVVEPLARQKGIAFEAATIDGMARIITDPDKARQILVNLAGNAVKFTDRGSVRLTISNGVDDVRFAVHDTGIGIADSDRPRLFHPFSQLDGGLTRRHGGTGLGLYISRRLAQLVDGRIELESEPGRGSTFTLVLPGREGPGARG